jgi:hypothetical protein
MQRTTFLGSAVLLIVVALALASTSCFGDNSFNSSSSKGTPTVVKPQPTVVSTVASTSGTQSAYFATLDIKVKNSGAEGTILVQANITQNGKTSQNEMPVFLKQNEEHELKMTFPLTWQGGEFTSSVQAIIP